MKNKKKEQEKIPYTREKERERTPGEAGYFPQGKDFTRVFLTWPHIKIKVNIGDPTRKITCYFPFFI